MGTDVVRIASISGNTITATGSFTWDQNDSVYFGSSSSPDIGAYPYRSGGYNITCSLNHNDNDTVSQGIVDLTAAVNNSDLVRFVEFWVDGVPVAIDHQSPYQYSWDAGNEDLNSEHELKVIARPLYASKTLAYEDTAFVTIDSLPPARSNFQLVN